MIGTIALALITGAAYTEVTDGNNKNHSYDQRGRGDAGGDELRLLSARQQSGRLVGREAGMAAQAGATVAIEEAVGLAAIEAAELEAIRYARWQADAELAQWIEDSEYAQAQADARARAAVTRSTASRQTGRGGTSGGSGFCAADYLRPWFGSNASAAASVCWCESKGNPNATGGAGERGLFQIHPVHGSGSTYSVEGNIRFAAQLSNGGSNWSAWTCKP